MTEINKYRCKICLDLFAELTDAEYHVENSDEMHSTAMSKWGLPNCIDMVTVDDLTSVQTTLEENTREVEVKVAVNPYLPNLPKEFTDYAKMYPYPPYYRYGRKGKQRYLCLKHNFETQDIGEWLRHMNDSEEEKVDTEDWLVGYLKDIIYDDIRTRRGSKERITDEQLEKMARDQLKVMMLNGELQAPKTEPLTGMFKDRDEKLSKFLQGCSGVCPVCALAEMNLSSDEFHEKEILSQLKPTKGRFQKYEGMWNGEKVELCLHANMHAHLSHKEIYKGLFTSGTLKGGLPQWLVNESYLSKKPFKEELTQGLVPAKEKLSKAEKGYLKWFSDGSK
jgi:hypothetical protein